MPKPNYHSKVFSRKPASNRNEKKIQLKINKPIYLGLSISEISKTIIY